MPRRRSIHEILLAAATGAVAGTLATYIMDKSVEAVLGATDQDGRADLTEEELHQGSARSKANVEENLEGEPSTMQLTGQLAQAVLDRPATRRQRELGGYVFHYAYGATAGALYGGLAGSWTTITRGAGVPYGTAVWLVGDEAMITLLRLGRTPDQTPARSHVTSLLGHWAFGVALHLFHGVLQRRRR